MSTSPHIQDDFKNASKAESYPAKPISPVSFRVSEEQRLRLIEDAGRMPRGAYIRWKLFEEQPARGRCVQNAHIDYEAIARLTAKLGEARLSSNINQLAKASNMGSLIVDDEVKAELLGACADIASMRGALLKALNLRSGV